MVHHPNNESILLWTLSWSNKPNGKINDEFIKTSIYSKLVLEDRSRTASTASNNIFIIHGD